MFLSIEYQSCVTRVGTRTRVQFFSLWLGLGLRLRNRDSCTPESTGSSGRAVLRCLLWHSIHFVVCFHDLEDKQMLNMWTTRFVTRTRIFFGLGLGLWGDDLDSDFEVMTWNDSDLTTWTQTQYPRMIIVRIAELYSKKKDCRKMSMQK